MRRIHLVLVLVLLARVASAAGLVMWSGCGGLTCSTNLSNTSTPQFFSARGSAAVVTTESAAIESVVPMPGALAAIRCGLFSTAGAQKSPGAGTDYTFTLRVNEADSSPACTCQISGTNQTCTASCSTSIAAGDRINFKSIATSSPSSSVGKCSVEFDPS